MFSPRQFLHNGWIVVDQALNWVVFGAPDETISGRLGRYKNAKGWRRTIGRPLAAAVDFVAGKGHCENTWKYEKSIVHRPESFDDKPGD